MTTGAGGTTLIYTKIFRLYGLYTQLKLDLIIDVANWLYSYVTPAELGQRIGAPRAPQLQIHSIQPIKLTESTPIQRRLCHGAPELTQSKKITAYGAPLGSVRSVRQGSSTVLAAVLLQVYRYSYYLVFSSTMPAFIPNQCRLLKPIQLNISQGRLSRLIAQY